MLVYLSLFMIGSSAYTYWILVKNHKSDFHDQMQKH